MLTENQLHQAVETWLSRGGTLFLEHLTERDRVLVFRTWQASHYFSLIVDKEGFDAAMAAMPTEFERPYNRLDPPPAMSPGRRSLK